ncbi:MAG: hypothetical protein LBR38_03010, partial [Synergistaceae bacterium]|nr:hypothetical protein [Synergistaceae bacterium]
MQDVYGLVLAGGSGVRLWPRSREELPKQFLSLTGGAGGSKTMLQATLSRMLMVVPSERLHAVAGARWRSLILHQAAAEPDFLIEEPAARNTAPAILLGCCALLRDGADGRDVVVVTPSDHMVRDAAAFRDAVNLAVSTARGGCMVTLGVKPDRPETGFGYMKRGRPLENGSFEVERFVEKPDEATAAEYVASGGYFWNGGIFVFTLDTLYRELERTCPALAFRDYDAMVGAFADLPSISFDNAVMEGAERVAAVELDAGWSDVGSWDSLYDVMDKDEAGNALTGDVTSLGSRGCLVDSRDRLTALLDVDGLIVVDSPDALFIASRGSSQKVRDVVEALRGRREAVQASESARPWGVYKVLCEEERFKIKRIVIAP